MLLHGYDPIDGSFTGTSKFSNPVMEEAQKGSSIIIADFDFVEDADLYATDGATFTLIEGWEAIKAQRNRVDPATLLAQERRAMTCSRAQGKTVIGPDIWNQVTALAKDMETPWGLKVVIYDTYVWNRLDPNMDALIWAMGLTPEQADDLFRTAMDLM